MYKLELNKINNVNFPANSLILSIDSKIRIRFQGEKDYIIEDILGNFTDSTGAAFLSIGSFTTYWNNNFNVPLSFDTSGLATSAKQDSIKVSIDATATNQTNGAQKTQIVDVNGNPPLFSGTPIRLSAEITRPNTTPTYSALDSINETTPVIKTLAGAALVNGGGGLIMDCMIETDDVTNFAGKTVCLWIYKDLPTAIADDVAFTNLYTNKDKRVMSIQATFNTPVAGSDSCVAEVSVGKEYVCLSTAKDLYCALQYVSGGIAAASKKFNIALRVLAL